MAVLRKSKFCRYCQRDRTPEEMRQIKTARGKAWRCVHCADRNAKPLYTKRSKP